MCPACMTTVALLAVGATSTDGMIALVAKTLPTSVSEETTAQTISAKDRDKQENDVAVCEPERRDRRNGAIVGTMLQEAHETHPPIREACDKSTSEYAAMLEADIAEAMLTYGIDAGWSAESLALYTQAVIQGAFILAKAKHGPNVAADCLDHLRRYLEMLFTQPQPKETRQ